MIPCKNIKHSLLLKSHSSFGGSVRREVVSSCQVPVFTFLTRVLCSVGAPCAQALMWQVLVHSRHTAPWARHPPSAGLTTAATTLRNWSLLTAGLQWLGTFPGTGAGVVGSRPPSLHVEICLLCNLRGNCLGFMKGATKLPHHLQL